MGKIFAAEAEFLQIVEHSWFLDAAEERLLKGKAAASASAATAAAPAAPAAAASKPAARKKRD